MESAEGSAGKGVKNDFLERLREKTGLVIRPGQRNVEVLVFEGR